MIWILPRMATPREIASLLLVATRQQSRETSARHLRASCARDAASHILPGPMILVGVSREWGKSRSVSRGDPWDYHRALPAWVQGTRSKSSSEE